MATKYDLQDWVIDALEAHGGSAEIVEICKHIWHHHETDLKTSGDLLYTWQYDMRWAGNSLRAEGKLLPKPRGDRGPWRLAR